MVRGVEIATAVVIVWNAPKGEGTGTLVGGGPVATGVAGTGVSVLSTTTTTDAGAAGEAGAAIGLTLFR